MIPFDLAVLNKAFLLITATALVGTLSLPLFVLPAATAQRFTRTLLLATVMAAIGVALFSLLDMYFVLAKLGRGVSGELFVRYLQNSRHGTAVMWREGLIVATVLAAFLVRYATAFRYVAMAGSLAVIASISFTSHAAAMGSPGAFFADFVHFSATGIWAGAILVSLVLPIWQKHQVKHVATRISRIGTFAAIAIVLTGVFASLLHVEDPERFVTSSYAFALVIKIVLAVLVFSQAAVNRMRHMGNLDSDEGVIKFRRGMRTEAILLLVLFVATGALSSAEMPHVHDPNNAPTVFDNARGFIEFIRGQQ